MYLLVASKVNGDVHYYGPFKTKARAEDYALSLTPSDAYRRWHVANLIQPYHQG